MVKYPSEEIEQQQQPPQAPRGYYGCMHKYNHITIKGAMKEKAVLYCEKCGEVKPVRL